MENSDGKMPGSEMQSGELTRDVPVEEKYNPEEPSVIHIEVESSGQIFMDWRNFQNPMAIMIALQQATAAAMQQLQTMANSRPMPPRPSWARGGK